MDNIMKSFFIIIISFLFIAGCSQKPTMEDVRKYGEERFISDLLAVRSGKKIPKEMQELFKPIRAEAHLNGAWIVIKKSSSYESGIYVDQKSIHSWGGSGMEVTPWSGKIGWSKEKVKINIPN